MLSQKAADLFATFPEILEEGPLTLYVSKQRRPTSPIARRAENIIRSGSLVS
jgi:hypothetical protein